MSLTDNIASVQALATQIRMGVDPRSVETVVTTLSLTLVLDTFIELARERHLEASPKAAQMIRTNNDNVGAWKRANHDKVFTDDEGA